MRSDLALTQLPHAELWFFSSAQLANIPASVPVAATARSGPRGYHHTWHSYHHTWRYRHAWRAVVRASVVAVATTAAIRVWVKARSTTTGDRNCQTGLRLFEQRERHGLGSGNAEETDPDSRSERKKFSHSFLLGCLKAPYILRGRRVIWQDGPSRCSQRLSTGPKERAGRWWSTRPQQPRIKGGSPRGTRSCK